MLGVAAILYGSLAPFQFDFTRTPTWNPGWCTPAPGDTASNILIYIPIGAFLRLWIRRRGSFWFREMLVSLTLAGGMSYLTEVMQSIIPARVSTWTDVLLNTAGAGIGVCFAPQIQRWLRNLHATLYVRLRSAPMSTAATVATLCVCTFALMPLDIRPSPGHVAHALSRFLSPPGGLLWWPTTPGQPTVDGIQIVDKLMAAGSYGLLAFLLLLSAREANRSLRSSVWHALSRTMALAALLEMMQAFTISHAADLRDLLSAWMCCAAGSAAGSLIVGWCPDLHHRPSTVLRGLVLIVTLALLAWALASVSAGVSVSHHGSASWLPMIASFNRSWSGLLGDYVTGLLQYTLAAALLVLWYRSHWRLPWAALVVMTTLSCAMLAGAIAVHRHHAFDTAQILLAMAGAVTAIRLDRALFGRQ